MTLFAPPALPSALAMTCLSLTRAIAVSAAFAPFVSAIVTILARCSAGIPFSSLLSWVTWFSESLSVFTTTCEVIVLGSLKFLSASALAAFDDLPICSAVAM